ncbi:NAD-dependent epimerase/dehydratase family protein [Chryseolinea sp. T2]|uniref:NAD-dependent epimerase/dehydratase family protein n=1 Tax=Chryseolinea sp. T2 TaxID=3129255 RepID=UPI0030768C56
MTHQKVLVIGAGGQLGSELTQGLWRLYGKQNVVATDVKPAEGVLATGEFEILDVLNSDQLQNLVSKNKFTQIYHLAAVLSATGEKNPKLAWRLNMEGLINVMDIAVDQKVSRVYWPSSIAAFGPTTPKIKTPQDTIMDPTTVYGISKLAGERWCEWYFKNKGLDVRSLRYPGLIGYKTKPGGGTTDYAVDIFFKALTEKKFTCFLKPDTYLPMMYMDDAVKATLQLMEAPAANVKVRSSYNVTGMSFCPAEIVKEIQKFIPEFEISYAPDFRQQIADSWPKSINDAPARIDWGWEPAFDLDDMTADILKNLPSLLDVPAPAMLH